MKKLLWMLLVGCTIQAMNDQTGSVDLNRLEQGDNFRSSLHPYFEQMHKSFKECDSALKRYSQPSSISFVKSCYHTFLEVAGTQSEIPLDIQSSLKELYRTLSREDWNERQRKLNKIDDIQDAEIMGRIALQESNSKQVIALLNHLYQMELLLKSVYSGTVPYATFSRFCTELSGHINEYNRLYISYFQQLDH